MLNFRMLPFLATAVVLFAIPVFADDPAMQQNGSSCPGGGAWCGSSTEAVDTTTGIDTLEYIFSSAVAGSINYVGWAEGTIGGTAAELLHFVITSGGQDAVFLYCGGNSANICASDDDVLPSSYETSNVFNMGSSPYDSTYTPGSGPGSGTYGGGAVVYGILSASDGNLKGTVVTPEASSVVLLGAMMIALVFVRKKFSAVN